MRDDLPGWGAVMCRAGLLCLLLAGCGPVAVSPPLAPTPTPTPALTCGGYPLDDPALTCAEQAGGLLLQSPAADQARLALDAAGSTLTLRGTAYLRPDAAARSLALIALEGTAIVAARQSTRIVPAGRQLVLSLNAAGDIASVPEVFLTPEAALLRPLRLAALPRPVTLPLTATAADPAATTGCQPRADWLFEYTIQPGDTLSRLAQPFGLPVAEVQAANCLASPDRLTTGSVIRLPGAPVTGPLATATPSAVAFRVDAERVPPGACTVVRWDVLNVSAVFFEGEAVAGSGVRQVCPAAGATYTLRVRYPDATESQHTVSVSVGP
ncbi:MAG: LysM peptidoglycan-binding domain-containing protein [Anaerolineae bacterium]|nr:LysM peptidoglycan-binding domain-containing protein [Anaerolineae bacterium]